jgi:phosphatidylglycerophosphate synthase
VVPFTEMAHALTTVRLLLILPFVLLMAHGEPHAAALAAGVLAVAIVSDVLDGIIARRRGTASAAGGLFDHTTDCLFVTAGLAAMAGRSAAPWILPVLVLLVWALVVSTLVSMGERLWAVRELRRTARGLLAAGTGDRSRH